VFARLVDICDQLRQCHALNVRDFLQVIPEGIFKANAGRDKPSYGIVATADRALNPTLARWMYKRSGAKITEIKGPFSLHRSPSSGRQRHRKSCPLHQREYNEASISAFASLHLNAAASLDQLCNAAFGCELRLRNSK
jgi:hypothetical protein